MTEGKERTERSRKLKERILKIVTALLRTYGQTELSSRNVRSSSYRSHQSATFLLTRHLNIGSEDSIDDIICAMLRIFHLAPGVSFFGTILL